MEEIKKLILEDEEVDEYNKLQDKFEEAVDERFENDKSIRKSVYSLLIFIVSFFIFLIICGIFDWL